MRQLCFAVMACLVLSSCEDILPVDNIDRCEGDEPASADCDQCAGEEKAAGCPQCRGDNPASGCQNASGVSGGGKAGSAGAGKSGEGGSSAGHGGGSGTASAGSGGGGGGNAGSTSGNGGSSGGSGGGGSSGSGGSTGGNGGSEAGSGGASGGAGDAGMPPAPCDASLEDCANPTPRCDSSGSCVACDDDTACTGRSGVEHCEQRAGAGFRGQCVECTSHAHCSDPAKPQCGLNGACEPCSGNDACSERAGASKCDVANGSPLQGRCVECLAHADCSDLTKAECSSERSCVACTGDEACSERTDHTKCNPYDGATAKGHCVKCTGDNESVCGDYACKRSTGTCTDKKRGDVGLCEACEADSECEGNATGTSRCVAYAFGQQPLGTFCFHTDPNGNNCANTNASRKPYSRRLMDIKSIDGVDGPFCAPITTCEAVRDASSQKTCAMSSECGVEGLADANCVNTKCTYGCVQDYDCLDDDTPGRFSECMPPGGAGYCQ